MPKIIKVLLIILLTVTLISIPFESWLEEYLKPPPMSYDEFMTVYNEGDVDKIWYSANEEYMRVILHDNISCNMSYEERLDYTGNQRAKIYLVPYPKTETFREDMLGQDIILIVKTMSLGITNKLWLSVFIVALVGLLCLLYKLVNPNGGQENTFISPKDIPTRFADIIGHDEIIADLSFITNFIKKPKLGMSLGARIPRGILLSGPTGTGKTMLAQAIAGECGVPFMYVNASSLIEVWAGKGAARVRQIFKDARKNAPCVIFIDEIDAVGGSREKEISSTEDRQTLNAILQEMDGFKTGNGILVIAATNTPETLDSALVRAGRFDRQIVVGAPCDWQTRLKLFESYFKNKPLSSDVNLTLFAKSTPGFTGATISMIANEAALIALAKSHEIIMFDDIEEAVDKTMLKGNRKISDRLSIEHDIVRYHESGHAVVMYKLGISIVRVSVQGSTSGVGGFVSSEDDKCQLLSRKDIENKIKTLYGGRLSEEIKFGEDNATIGAVSDIDKATELLYQYSSVFGFNENCGLLNWKLLSKYTVDKTVLNEIKTTAHILYDDVRTLLQCNYDLVEGLADILQTKESVSGAEVVALFSEIERNRK